MEFTKAKSAKVIPRESTDVYDDDAHTGDPERDLAYEREQAQGGYAYDF